MPAPTFVQAAESEGNSDRGTATFGAAVRPGNLLVLWGAWGAACTVTYPSGFADELARSTSGAGANVPERSALKSRIAPAGAGTAYELTWIGVTCRYWFTIAEYAAPAGEVWVPAGAGGGIPWDVLNPAAYSALVPPAGRNAVLAFAWANDGAPLLTPAGVTVRNSGNYDLGGVSYYMDQLVAGTTGSYAKTAANAGNGDYVLASRYFLTVPAAGFRGEPGGGIW